MVQQTGETRDAIIATDEKRIEAIMNANAKRREPYWIVIFVRPGKERVEGKPTLIKYVNPAFNRPRPQVGMIIGEVDNVKGTVEWDVNMPQRPFDVNGLLALGAQSCDELVTETTSIPGAYLTR